MHRLFVFALVLCAATVARGEELAKHEQLMVEQCNEFRVRSGLAPLRPAPWLMARARQHCRWMLSNGMIHSSGVAENIATGQPGVFSVTNTWINSAGHNANMRGNHTHIGVAGYTAPNGSTYWVQQFGSENGSPVAVEGGGGSSYSSNHRVGHRIFGRRR